MALYPAGREGLFRSRDVQAVVAPTPGALLGGLCEDGVIPRSSQRFLLVPQGGTIYVRDDEVMADATVGFPVVAGQPFTYDLQSIDLVTICGSNINCRIWFYS